MEAASFTMTSYSNEEYCEMVLLYGACGRRPREAARQYAVRFPDRSHPTANTIINVVRRLRETGSIASRPRSCRPRPRRNRAQPEDVLAYALAHPHSSTRDISAACGLTSGRVWQILHTLGAYPYSATLMQGLYTGDPQRRYDWCNFVMNTLDVQPNFMVDILWTDEAKFDRCGVFNRHNSHQWALENPSWQHEVRHQVRWSLNVWCGIWNNRLIGPVFYDGTLTGQRYWELLQTTVTGFLEDLPLVHLRSVWFQHDGAPPHRVASARNFLVDNFGHKIVGYGGTVEWPPRSPDLTPMDFFLWGYLKDQVYSVPTRDVHDLRDRIIHACSCVTPEMLQGVQRNVRSRVQLCIAANGGHFEHTLR